MQLREWQQHFQNIVLGTMPVDASLLQKKGLSPALSIGIYANAYRERLHEALRSNYGALHQLLGDSDFADMAYAFMVAKPPQTVSIRWFGDMLPTYLRSTEPYCHCPALAELAQFEWALRHTVDAADAERLDADFLQTLNAEQWAGLRCDTHPSLTILRFGWNAPQVWRALDAGEIPPTPNVYASAWFVYRDVDLTTQWRSADTDEAAAIQLWARGDDFSAICDFLQQQMDEKKADGADTAAATAASFMRTWIEQGLLVHQPTVKKPE